MGSDGIHLLPVSKRVEIQVAPLNHVNRILVQKFDQRINFLGRVGKAGAVQIVNRHKFLPINGNIDAFDHIRKIIILGLKVGLVTFPADAV